MAVRPSEDLGGLVVRVEGKPSGHRAHLRRIQRHIENSVRRLDLHHVPGLDLVGRHVDRLAVDLKVPVGDQLSRLLAGRAEAESVNDVVQAKLEVAEQIHPGHAGLLSRRVKVVPELLLEQPVHPSCFLLRAQLDAVVRRLSVARLAMHAGRNRAARDGALRRVAALALEVELGALAAAETADGAAVVRHRLDPPPLRRPAAVVRDRRHVRDRADLEACRLQRPDRGLTAGARPAHENLDRSHAVLEGPFGCGLSGDLSSVRSRLAAALEALRPGGAPRDDVTVDVADRDDRVVERALDVGLTGDNVLALSAPRAYDFLLCHYLPALTFFLPATARFGPRRLRALVRVRWPRTGRPRRCLWPR